MKATTIRDLVILAAIVAVPITVVFWPHTEPEGGRNTRRAPTARGTDAAPHYFPDDPVALEEFVAVEALRRLMDAVEQVESGGNCKAVGDGGKSKGPLQCGKLAWWDALDFAGIPRDDSGWLYEKWVWDLPKSRQVFIWYTDRWGAETLEERARCWNSGPKWKSKYPKTDKYWKRVSAEMSATRN
jgi:hypothetical protein